MAASSVFTQSVTTSWVDLESRSGQRVSILNSTGADLLIRMKGDNAAGRTTTLADTQSVALGIVAVSSEIQISAAAGAAGVQVVVD